VTITDTFAIACAPVLAISVLCIAAGLTRPMGQSRKALISAGGLLFGVCALGAVASPLATSLMVANYWIAMFLVGFLGLSLALFLALSPTARANLKTGKTVGWLLIVINMVTGSAFLALGGWYFIGDFLLERQHVQGMLIGKHTKHRIFGIIPSYYLRFDGREHETTADVYENIRDNGYSRAEIGGGSKTIFKIEPVPFPETAPPIQQYPSSQIRQN
jgi:hypothetical protein